MISMRYYILFVYLFITILSWGQAPLIGAYYFDGWAGNNKKVNEKWAQNAPTHLTKELALTFNSRQPIWGWRDDKLEIMEKQIDIAAKNGIDFFSFCWYWRNDNSNIDTTKINKDPLHTSIELFKKSANKRRMKFSLLIANHQGSRIKTKKDWLDAVDFWTKHYFNDSQYLKIDGKPVITIFASHSVNEFIPAIRKYIKEHTPYKDLFILSNKYYNTDSNYDALSWYNIREIEPGYSEERNYKTLMNNTIKTWKATDTNICVAPCVMVNWDRRPWETTTKGLYYTGRTPKLFREQLKAAFLFTYQQHHRIIMIYAWNELGEGGYLIPTLGDKKAIYLKQIKKIKRSYK